MLIECKSDGMMRAKFWNARWRLRREDPEANYSLGMVFAQADDTAKAYEYLQRALKARPVYPEALNNLGVLYLVTQRRDQAVASFEQCIRVAPGVRSGVSESGARICAGRRAGQGPQRLA